MRFHNANYDFAPLGLFLPRGLQHGVGLSHTRRHPEENLQFAASRSRFFPLHLREQRIWVGPLRVLHTGELTPILR